MLIYLILSIVATAIHFVWISGVMKRMLHMSSLFVMAASHLVASLVLMGFTDNLSVLNDNIYLIANILGFSLCMLVARMLYYYAFSKADVSEVTIFSSLTPTYTLVIAPFFGYSMTVYEMIGVILISCSVYFFFLPSRKHQSFDWRYICQPVTKIFTSKPLFYTFLSTFPPVFATIFQKQAIEASSPMLVSFAMTGVVGVLGFIIIIAKKMIAQTPIFSSGHLQHKIIFSVVVAGLLQAAMILSISYTLSQTHPASMQALLRFAIPLQMLLAYLFLHEKKHIRHRLFSGLLAVVGGYIVVQSEF